MKSRVLSLLFLMLLACVARAQSVNGAPFRVGDSFDLHLSGADPEFVTPFNMTYTVDDDGNINMQMVGKIKVLGLLPNQVQDAIQNALVDKKIFTHPLVVVTSNSARFVNLMGEVRSPQRVQYTPDMTFLTAINACGGFTDYANKKSIKMIRDGKVTEINAIKIQQNPTSDFKVLPGDQFIIKQTLFFQ